MALGTAAVMAVYAAGYARTRAAAERLAGDDHRRPVMPAPPEAGPPPSMPDPPPSPAQQPISEAPRRATNARTVKRARRVTTTPAAPAVATSSTSTSKPDTPAQPIAEPSPATAPVVTVPPPPIAVVDPKPAEPAAPAKPVLKDGTYSGWGTSRHGDIQATIVIEHGRIVSSSISQCLTRYSCSWIAGLVPQVVQRQSAEVDYVSGATQSTNAFYYAVVDALSKAR